jgi:hypothetical protein
MGFFKKLFGKPNDYPASQEVKEDIFERRLTGKEDMCEYCKRPIFRDTEQWTKLQGHYFHRTCWKIGVKNNAGKGL